VSKLLVPVDGSEPALRALEHAIARTRANAGGSVHLVTAHEAIVPYPDIGIVYHPYEQRVALQRKESEAILQAGERRLKAAGVPYTSEVLTGPVAGAIAARADALGCEEIVMGTRGRGPAGSLVLGSVSAAVVHAARVPVTLVK
jgi:nucleotide-binding universal stress UspA family protein